MSPSITAGLGNLQIIWSWRRDGYNWVIATTVRSKWPGEGLVAKYLNENSTLRRLLQNARGPSHVRSLDRGSAAPNIFRMQTGTETMKTWSRPRTVPLLLRVCYWFSSFVEKWECRRVWQNECKRTASARQWKFKSKRWKLSLRESGSVANQGVSSRDFVEVVPKSAIGAFDPEER